jgi:hypothetical protein
METAKTNNFVLSLVGNYQGNVGGLIFDIGNVIRTGKLSIETDNDNLIITTCSWFNDKLTNIIKLSEIEKIIDDKTVTILDDNVIGIEFKCFDQKTKDAYLDKLIYIDTRGYWIYQLKFKNDNLIAIKIKEYKSPSKSMIKQLIINNIEKVTDDTSHPDTKNDWNF